MLFRLRLRWRVEFVAENGGGAGARLRKGGFDRRCFALTEIGQPKDNRGGQNA
jgi:hypothetical protein